METQEILWTLKAQVNFPDWKQLPNNATCCDREELRPLHDDTGEDSGNSMSGPLPASTLCISPDFNLYASPIINQNQECNRVQ